MRRTLCLLLAFCCLLLGGCGNNGADRILNYISPGTADLFDPQFATQQNAQLILHNIGEGLLVRQADGSLTEGLAESYTVSEDGLRYTFTLREELCWEDGSPLTADDFVFAFSRLFDPGAPSPFAADYLCLYGAAALLAGENAALGVVAPDDRTVTFLLETANASFLQKLAEPAAFPCSRSFFAETRGKYGRGKQHILANGPFRISDMGDTYLSLRRNNRYHSTDAVVPRGVNIHFSTDSTPYEKLVSGNVELAEVSFDQLQELQQAGYRYDSFDSTVWVLCFSPDNGFLREEAVRRGIAMAIDRSAFADSLAENYTETAFLLPPTVRIGSERYRDLSTVEAVPFDPAAARESLLTGLQARNASGLPELTLLVPQEQSLLRTAGSLQKQLQQHLSLFVNIRALEEADYNAALQRGEYDLVLRAVSFPEQDPLALLQRYEGGAVRGGISILNSTYDDLLQQMTTAPSEAALGVLASQAEQLLLDSCSGIPLFTQTRYLASSPKTSGFSLSNDPTRIYFKDVYLYE